MWRNVAMVLAGIAYSGFVFICMMDMNKNTKLASEIGKTKMMK
jgi:hypothetical protein